MGLYQEHRPKTLAEVEGQSEAVKILSRMLQEENVPPALMFSGPSGTGKTTCARILATELGCHEQDFAEMNCADVRGIDNVRDIQSRMSLHPWGKCRIYLIDEAHGLTKDAQNAMLKMLEDAPPTVHFILCTTDPVKLITTVRNRCTEIKLVPLSDESINKLVWRVLEKLGAELEHDVTDKIVDTSEGSARKALVILEKVLALDDYHDQMNAVASPDVKSQSEFIGKILLENKPDWSRVVKSIKNLTDADVESLRRGILGYCKAVLLGNSRSQARAYLLITAFENPFHDSGVAGFAATVWNICK